MKITALLVLLTINCAVSILYPTDSETRTVKDLSGKWKFCIDDSPTRDRGFVVKWWNNSLGGNLCKIIDMPVPASYNDITQDRSIRDFVGWAWYQTEFYAPISWLKSLVWLRIGSAHYYSVVWINSIMVIEHEGGHLPFEAEISKHLRFGGKNMLTIALNNTLTPNTLPPGTITFKSEEQQYPTGYFIQDYQFDFFNYAGIHRPVKLYTTPVSYIKEVAMISTLCDSSFRKCDLKYSVQIDGSGLMQQNLSLRVSLLDAQMRPVASNGEQAGYLIVNNANLWWPIGMNESVAYLYTLLIELNGPNGNLVDIYRLKVGIRTVEVKGTKFLINGKPFYFVGVGKHEDWDIRGKGFDWPSIVKDFNLLEWIGANSFRTSHYPYSEEIMQMCNERGFVVVDECPAVGMHYKNNFVNKTLIHHLKVMDELIARDRNHPSVVMWSVANEPKSSLIESEEYFKTVIQHTKAADGSRPVTFVCNADVNLDRATQFVDVVSVNKYSSWYEDSGHTEVIQKTVGYFLNQWFEKRKKPVIHMEWGAGVVAGMHSDPSLMFTEEYLEDVMVEHFKVFDSLQGDFLAGEMIWNFADFATKQGTTRVVGNKKGLLTRQRQPKSAAFLIRKRYHALRNQTTVF